MFQMFYIVTMNVLSAGYFELYLLILLIHLLSITVATVMLRLGRNKLAFLSYL